MKTYIGTKIIQAKPMSQHEFAKDRGKAKASRHDEAGYVVVYSDSYVSWSPKDVFETAYRELTSGETRLISS